MRTISSQRVWLTTISKSPSPSRSTTWVKFLNGPFVSEYHKPAQKIRRLTRYHRKPPIIGRPPLAGCSAWLVL
jgi:hypothetical protein